MKLKSINDAEAFVTVSGKIAIAQHSFELGKIVHVYLTLDQFRQLQKWVDENEQQVMEAWNDGVDDETEA